MYITLYYTFIDAFYRKSLKLDASKSNQQENGVNSRRIVCTYTVGSRVLFESDLTVPVRLTPCLTANSLATAQGKLK